MIVFRELIEDRKNSPLWLVMVLLGLFCYIAIHVTLIGFVSILFVLFGFIPLLVILLLYRFQTDTLHEILNNKLFIVLYTIFMSITTLFLSINFTITTIMIEPEIAIKTKDVFLNNGIYQNYNTLTGKIISLLIGIFSSTYIFGLFLSLSNLGNETYHPQNPEYTFRGLVYYLNGRNPIHLESNLVAYLNNFLAILSFIIFSHLLISSAIVWILTWV